MCGRVKGASSSSIVVSLGAHHGVPARTYEFRKSMPDPKSKKSFSAQMVEGCNKMGMKPVCNHPSYCRTDPHAIYIGQDSHLSVGPYNRNPKMVPKRVQGSRIEEFYNPFGMLSPLFRFLFAHSLSKRVK